MDFDKTAYRLHGAGPSGLSLVKKAKDVAALGASESPSFLLRQLNFPSISELNGSLSTAFSLAKLRSVGLLSLEDGFQDFSSGAASSATGEETKPRSKSLTKRLTSKKGLHSKADELPLSTDPVHRLCLVYEMVDSSLSDLMDQESVGEYFFQLLGPAQLKTWARQLCYALHALHEANVSHCNISPASVFVTADNDIKLGHFLGPPPILIRDDVAADPNDLIWYQAPEIISKKRQLSDLNAGQAADIWSLGCIVLEICTARRMSSFIAQQKSEPSAKCVIAGVNRALEALDQLPHAAQFTDLKELLTQMLHQNPRRRAVAGSVLASPFFSTKAGAVRDSFGALSQGSQLHRHQLASGAIFSSRVTSSSAAGPRSRESSLSEAGAPVDSSEESRSRSSSQAGSPTASLNRSGDKAEGDRKRRISMKRQSGIYDPPVCESVIRKELALSKVEEAGMVLAEAFKSDPRYAWMVTSGRWQKVLGEDYFPTMLKFSITQKRMGSVWSIYVDGKPEAVAAWLPPHREKKWPLAACVKMIWKLRSFMSMGDLQAGISGLKSVQKEYLKAFAGKTNWCLFAAGVHPNLQGRGFGTALLQPVLGWADADGVFCGLYTFDARTIPFFERLGFQVIKKVRALRANEKEPNEVQKMLKKVKSVDETINRVVEEVTGAAKVPTYWILCRPPQPIGDVFVDGLDGEDEEISTTLYEGKLVVQRRFMINESDLKLEKEIGKGTFGAVWRGKWRSVDVAVKVVKELNEEAERQLLAEAKQLQRLRPHPNIVTLYGVCPSPLSLITHFCSGGSLADLLYSRDMQARRLSSAAPSLPLSLVQTRRLIMGVVLGLSHLHCEDVIHRDLAARNVLVEYAGSVGGGRQQGFTAAAAHGRMCAKLTDFGMAITNSAADVDEMKKKAENQAQPLKWMAPEQLTERAFSTASDVFALGMFVYELVTATPPWGFETSAVDAAKRVIKGQRPKLPAHAQDFYTLCKGCWRTKPSDRFSVDQVCINLQREWPDSNSLDDLFGDGGDGTQPNLAPGHGNYESPLPDYVEPSLEENESKRDLSDYQNPPPLVFQSGEYVLSPAIEKKLDSLDLEGYSKMPVSPNPQLSRREHLPVIRKEEEEKKEGDRRAAAKPQEKKKDKSARLSHHDTDDKTWERQVDKRVSRELKKIGDSLNSQYDNVPEELKTK